jgi:hypothetical protein
MSTHPPCPVEPTDKILKCIVTTFFKHQITLKMLHFQTDSFAIHKATDKYLEKFDSNFDKFMEVAQGIHGKMNMLKLELDTIKLLKINLASSVEIKEPPPIEDIISKFMVDYEEFLNECNKAACMRNSSLQNIRDDMKADSQQFRYLLTFKQ